MQEVNASLATLMAELATSQGRVPMHMCRISKHNRGGTLWPMLSQATVTVLL